MVRCSELLDLIPKDRLGDITRNGAESSVPEDKKLELRLGLPGEDKLAEGSSLNGNHENGEFLLSSSKLFPFCSNLQSNHNNSKSGAKRALYEKTEGDGNWLNRNDEFQPHKMILSQKTAEKVPPLSPCPSGSLPSSAFQRQAWKLSQQSKSSYLQRWLMPQTLEKVVSEESSMHSLEPKSSHERVSVAPAVGWPPVRSFRKNFAARHSSKADTLGLSSETVKEENGSKPECCNGQMFVKVCMDGVPIGRKLNLQAYDNYEQLSTGIDELFHRLLAAQRDYLAGEDERKMEEARTLSDSKHVNGMYTLVYYDNEGDRMLVGDVPWKMFVSTVKKLHVLKSSAILATEME